MPEHSEGDEEPVSVTMSGLALLEVPESLRQWRNKPVRTVCLSRNLLKDLPPDLARWLPHCTDVDLAWNQLQTLPSCLGHLLHLRRLNVSFNPLQVLGPIISDMLALERLDASDCNLQAIPPALADLPHLRLVDVSFNGIRSLPKELGMPACSALEVRIQGNPLCRALLDGYWEGQAAFRASVLVHAGAVPGQCSVCSAPQGDRQDAGGAHEPTAPVQLATENGPDDGDEQVVERQLHRTDSPPGAHPGDRRATRPEGSDAPSGEQPHLIYQGVTRPYMKSAVDKDMDATRFSDSKCSSAAVSYEFALEEALAPARDGAGRCALSERRTELQSGAGTQHLLFNTGNVCSDNDESEVRRLVGVSTDARNTVTPVDETSTLDCSPPRCRDALAGRHVEDTFPSRASDAPALQFRNFRGSQRDRQNEQIDAVAQASPMRSQRRVSEEASEEDVQIVASLLQARAPRSIAILSSLLAHDEDEKEDFTPLSCTSTQNDSEEVNENQSTCIPQYAVIREECRADLSAGAPRHFLCPITHELMGDPVVLSDGHTYERAAIAQWIARRRTSPMTGAPLPHRALTPNYTIKSMIREYVESHGRK